MSDRLRGRRAIVTGASRGIGAATAERLAAEGADVAIVARTLTEHDHLAGSLQQTADRLRTYGTNVVMIAADVADEVARQDIVPESVTASTSRAPVNGANQAPPVVISVGYSIPPESAAAAGGCTTVRVG